MNMDVDPVARSVSAAAAIEPEAEEIDAVGDLVSNIFGYHGVCLSCRQNASRLLSRAQTLINHVLVVDERGQIRSPVHAQLDDLPIQDECIKLLIVDHVHQCSHAPVGFAELIRTIEQGGYLLLVEARDSIQKQLLCGLLRRPSHSLLAAQRRAMLVIDSGMTPVLSRTVRQVQRRSRLFRALFSSVRTLFTRRVELCLYRKDRQHMTPIRQQQFAKVRMKNGGLASYRTSRS